MVASEIGIDEVHAQLLPQEKVEILEQLLADQSVNGHLAFVGDGINDAPVLARADIGIAMGALGSDAAIEAADVVIMTDDLDRIAQAISLSKRTLGIVKQNIVLRLGGEGPRPHTGSIRYGGHVGRCVRRRWCGASGDSQFPSCVAREHNCQSLTLTSRLFVVQLHTVETIAEPRLLKDSSWRTTH